MKNTDYQTSSSIAEEESLLLKTAKLKTQASYRRDGNNNGKKNRVSRRILLANKNETVSVVCPDTGIVSLLHIPSIPLTSSGNGNNNNHLIMEWTSPFCSLHNCRGLVQAGSSYLSQLDSQVLAGMLITIGESYSLFRYQPADTGAQKNAVLRTAGKLLLINALLLIEDYMNSRNRSFLPQLSLTMDSNVEEGGISNVMTEWLKLCASIIIKNDFPDLEENENGEDEFHNSVPKKTITPEYVRARRKSDKASKALNWEKTNKKWAEQREYKEDIKTAKTILKTFSTVESISPKLMGLLKSVFNEDSLLTMDSATRALLATKLSSFTSSAANALVSIVSKAYPLLREESLSLDLDDLDNDSTDPSTNAEADSIPAETSIEEIEEIETGIEEEAGDRRAIDSRRIEDSAPCCTSSSIPSTSIPPVEKKLSFLEIIKAKRLAKEAKE